MDGKPENEEPRMLTLEEVFEPWELVGKSRRDCLPHRARLLRLMAYVSCLAGGLSIVCLVPALLGLPLGLLARAMARRDLDLICGGDMDHRGYHETEKARADSHAGVLLNLWGLFFWLFAIPGLVFSFALAMKNIGPWGG
jgi:hypothetical protein